MKFDVTPVRWGLLLALCGLLMGVYLGIHFGKSEDEILAHLKAKKESLALMAQAGAGLYLVSSLGVLASLAVFAVWKNNPPALFNGVFKSGE